MQEQVLIFGMTIPQFLGVISTVLGIIGVPSLSSLLIWIISDLKKQKAKTKANQDELKDNVKILMTAYQVQLRDTLMTKFKLYSKLGCITDEDCELWLDIYDQYHSLGANGVMDKRRDQILDLPLVDSYDDNITKSKTTGRKKYKDRLKEE